MPTIHVLESFAAPRRTTNPYIVQLADALSRDPDLEVSTFTWRAALLGRYDVLHVHWPDTLLQGKDGLRRFGKRMAARLLLARLRITRTPVVRTMHNPAPHEQDRQAQWIETRLAEMTRARIQINPATPLGPDDAMIPHGDYRAWFAPYDRRTPTPGAIAFVGLIRPYKGVEDLIAAYAELAGRRSDVTLRIAGNPRTSQLRDDLTRRMRDVPRSSAVFEYIDDDALVDTITASALTVLPYRGMTNSGMALAALSLDRRVLLPRTPVSESLQDEVGSRWVVLFDGELTAVALEAALDAPAPASDESVRFSGRDWVGAASAHRTVFESAISAAKGVRR